MKSQRIRSAFTRKISQLTGKYMNWQIWRDFVIMSATSISNSIDLTHFEERNDLYSKTAAQYTPEELSKFVELLVDTVSALRTNPDQDFLGDVYMELGLNNHWKGQFFTPYSICKMMGAMSMGNGEKLVEQIHQQGYITVNDPACGAGATLIAAGNAIERALYEAKSPLHWQDHVVMVAQDIDYIVGLMCYIQLSILGCAGIVKIGDSLSDPIHSGDDLTNYWFTPAYISLISKSLIDEETKH